MAWLKKQKDRKMSDPLFNEHHTYLSPDEARVFLSHDNKGDYTGFKRTKATPLTRNGRLVYRLSDLRSEEC